MSTTRFSIQEGIESAMELGVEPRHDRELTVEIIAEGAATLLEIHGELDTWLREESGLEETGDVTAGPNTYTVATKLVGRNLRRGPVTVREITALEDGETTDIMWMCRVQYTPAMPPRPIRDPGPRMVDKAIGEDEFFFSGSGATRNVKYALAVEDRDGGLPVGVMDAVEKLIGWTGGSAEEQEIKGVEITIPSLQIVHRKYYNRAAPFNTLPNILAHVASVSAQQGTMNNSTFHGFPAGSLLFRSIEGVRYVLSRDEAAATEVSYLFEFSPNRASVSIPGVDASDAPTTWTVSKRGWNVISAPMREVEINGVLLSLATAAFSQQVLPATDFSAIYPS